MSVAIEDSLKLFGKRIVKQSRSNLTKAKKNVSKDLYNSLSFEYKQFKQSFFLELKMEDYGKFQDLGVQGKTSNFKAPNSPFKFGSGTGQSGGLTEGINKWVRARRFQFRDKKGKFMSYESTAFLIIRSIWNKGIQATNFFTRPFENEFKKLPDELTKKYGLELDKFFKFVVK